MGTIQDELVISRREIIEEIKVRFLPANHYTAQLSIATQTGYRSCHPRKVISHPVIEMSPFFTANNVTREDLAHGDVEFLIPLQLEVSRNVNFVGREKPLQIIHEHITSQRLQGPDRITFSIFGMGGIGKTQIIQEYAYRYRKEFSSIFWVKANSYDSAVASYFSIAKTLVDYARPAAQEIGLVDMLNKINPDSLSEAFAKRVVKAVKWWLTLEGNNKWLLLFDNWDDLQDKRIESLIPNGSSGAVLITSRRQDWARSGHSLEIEDMEEAASLKLLSKSSLSEYGEPDQDSKS
jgi:hypothetical protein